MNVGLLGIGTEKDWIIEIDDLIDLGLYALNISHRRIELRTEGVRFDQFEKLQKFLVTDKEEDTFVFCTSTSAKVEFRLYEGALRLFLWASVQEGNGNMLQVSWPREEYQDFAMALKDAIKDATKKK
jgi:hypothetical protein